MRDVIVIGTDLADLAVAIKTADAGLGVTLVTKGVGDIQLDTGTVDILSYRPESVEAPLGALEGHIASRPTHPYSHVTPDFVGTSVIWLCDLVGADALIGDKARNMRIPTGVGALRPTYLIPPSIEVGIPRAGTRYAIAGLTRFRDFYPGLVAENLTRQNGPNDTPVNARILSVDYVVHGGEVDSTGTNHARSLDHEENHACLADQIRPPLQNGEIVSLLAVLGLDDPNAWCDLAGKLDRPVFETPIQPPSMPGMRLNTLLTRIASNKCRVILESPVKTVHTADGHVSAVEYASAGRSAVVETQSLILAAGGFESGTLDVNFYGTVRETICGLPVMGTSGQLLHADFWGEDQPLFLAGLAVSDSMRVLSEEGAPMCPNLYVTGGNLADATRWRERSGEGIALAGVSAAVDSIVEGLK